MSEISKPLAETSYVGLFSYVTKTQTSLCTTLSYRTQQALKLPCSIVDGKDKQGGKEQILHFVCIGSAWLISGILTTEM